MDASFLLRAQSVISSIVNMLYL
ncbi:hypothetical protein QZH41_020109, partial [Actinostola sp. cb2023]